MKETIKTHLSKTYFITGGAGFVGTHLTRLLLEGGHSVISMDNFENSDYTNVSEFINHKRFRFVRGSIVTDTDLLEYSITDSDIVIHLAASVGVQNATNKPSEMLKSNILGMMNVIDICNRKQKRLLVSSSSEVYGWSPKVPFDEYSEFVIPNPQRSRFSYALSKIVEEYYAYGYFANNNLPCTIFRLFNSTGVGQNNNHNLVIPSLVNSALTGKDIIVYGDGTQTRCFCDVTESVQAIYQLSLNDDTIGEIINIGTDKATSILLLAEMIKEESGSKSEIKLVPYKEAFSDGFLDMMERIPNLDKVKKYTNWEASISINEIIKNVVQYEKSKREIRDIC